MEENISYTMENSDSDSVHEWSGDLLDDSDVDFEYQEESTYGKEIWKMIDVHSYNDTDWLTHETCNAKYELLLNQFYGKNNFSVLQDYALNEEHNVLKTLIYVNNRVTPIITTYVKLLLTYDKYNKLHALKNNTKLNNDVIFNLIIKYL